MCLSVCMERTAVRRSKWSCFPALTLMITFNPTTKERGIFYFHVLHFDWQEQGLSPSPKKSTPQNIECLAGKWWRIGRSLRGFPLLDKPSGSVRLHFSRDNALLGLQQTSPLSLLEIGSYCGFGLIIPHIVYWIMIPILLGYSMWFQVIRSPDLWIYRYF